MHSGNSVAVRWLLIALAFAPALPAQDAKVQEVEGQVIVTVFGSKSAPAKADMRLKARDRLGTGDLSRAVLLMSERWTVRVGEQTDIEITPAALTATDKDALKLELGDAFIYSREEEGAVKVQTPTATGALQGTQLVVRVGPDGRTLMRVLEGRVDMSNEFGRVLLAAGEAGEAEHGQAPRKTAVIDAQNILQWALYYPAVLHPDELGLTGDERHALADSLEAYRQGDLLDALGSFPAGYAPASRATRLFHAGVALAAGQVDAARLAMAEVPADDPSRRALERMLAAVRHAEQPAMGTPASATEALAESYYQQSRGELALARNAAELATKLAPESGFAWTRLAELQFSAGRTRQARDALGQGMRLAPRNAQAHALNGFLLSADNRLAAAREAFQEAVRLDGGLGNGWLGLGLTKIRQGRLAEGRPDLQTAATVEPTRSFLYSYHGKALSMEGRNDLARKDLDRARQLDPNDPTPWLFAAILAQQENRHHTAINDLRESIGLNGNRLVYRSKFLLDQDAAVRGANLAKIYHHNAMTDLAVREAARAVERDHTSAAAHQFLANSFDALRDPRRVSLRYETAWFNEQLLASLLSPVGGGPLSQFVTQQEYSRMLEADGWGGSLLTEWRERFLDLQLSLFLTRGRFSSGIDYSDYRDRGERLNGDVRRRELYWQLKYQASPADILYTLVKWQHEEGGDLAQNYDNLPGNPGVRSEETQEPGLLLVGWNHQWKPGVNTLFLGGRLANAQAVTAPSTNQLLLQRDPAFLQPGFLRPAANGGLEYTADILRQATNPPASLGPAGTLVLSPDAQRLLAPFLGGGPVTGVYSDLFDFSTQREFAIHTAELQHIRQTDRNTLLVGGRWQGGSFDTRARLDLLNPGLASLFLSPAALQQVSVDFSRQSWYVYDFFNPLPGVTLTVGGSWDRVRRPENFRNPPVSSRQVQVERVNPKFGFTLAPSRWLTIRGAYTEAIGGVSFDESVRLEPVQLSAFNQAFRTVISESLVGSVEAPVYKSRNLSLEGSLPTRTWWSTTYSHLTEDVARIYGAFDILTAPVFPFGLAILPAGTRENLAYREEVCAAGLNQLLGTEFAVAAGYRLTRATLNARSPDIPVTLAPSADSLDRATLHELILQGTWNSPAGWFARAEARHHAQHLSGQAGGSPSATPHGDSFWLVDAQVGIRFHRNLREVSAGAYNLTDQDYHLSPLTYTREQPHRRTFFVRCRIGF